MVSLLLVIPLIYNDHLPDFHWRSITVGPPVKPIRPEPIPVRPNSGTPNVVAYHRPYLPSPVSRDSSDQRSRVGEASIELPGLIAGSDGAGPPMQFPLLAEKSPNIGPRPEVQKTPQQAAPSGPAHVSKGVQEAKIIRRVLPVYPALARTMRISGVVHLVGIIAKDGTIRNLQLISGHPMLAGAAIEAVRQWVYRPTLLSGEPVEVIAPIDVNFTLTP